MNRRYVDLLIFHFPLLGLPIIGITAATNNFQNHELLQILLGIVFGGGWIMALIYGFYRLSKLKLATKSTILWVFGLLWFSVVALPWMYWKFINTKAPE